MTTATVRITPPTRDQLRELAKQTGKSVQALLEEAVAVYRGRLAAPKMTPEGLRGSTEDSAARAFTQDELADDPNALAYKNLGRSFLAKNEGKYAAFCGGELVATSADKATVLARLRKEHPTQPSLVVKVEEQARVARFRRPRRMTRILGARM